MLGAAVKGAAASSSSDTAAFFGVDMTFYHMSIGPLLVLTAILAWMARPSTSEEIPPGFKSYQRIYLSVWAICVAADWLQGPYVYALYAAYGFDGHEIAQLFVAGFGASLVFGCLVGTLMDKYGRKRCCVAYCLLYIISCITKHWKHYGVLMFGRVTGGIATSLLFSCFECWMVSEHLSRNKFSGGLLSYMFGLMYNIMYAVAICSGLLAQTAADAWPFHPISKDSLVYVGGYCCPFDMAIACLIVGMIAILFLWKENYGSAQGENAAGMMENFGEALRVLQADKRVWLLCVVVACFEGAMYSFVFNWTPALQSKAVPPPYGVIFALFMMACMCGASVATIIGDAAKPPMRLLVTFVIGVVAFGTAAAVAGEGRHLMLTFACFMIFEVCCGVYFPTVGVLKSEIVPERVRGTMYNIYRVPLNAVVVCLLLTNLPMNKVFTFCALLIAIAAAAMGAIFSGCGPKTNDGEECPLVANKQV